MHTTNHSATQKKTTFNITIKCRQRRALLTFYEKKATLVRTNYFLLSVLESGRFISAKQGVVNNQW